MKRTLRRKSKRTPTRQRVKAEKKVREHNRKMRKESKLKGVSKKSQKPLTVPAECPFKEAILQEAEEARQRKEAEKAARRAKIKEGGAAGAGLRVASEYKDLSQLSKAAEEKGGEFMDAQEEEEEMTKENHAKTKEKSAKAYFKEFTKVVEAADVILQVLDARDPLGTRSVEVEKMVKEDKGKRVVLVLNKADLVPKENLEAWLKYLQRELPTMAFKSSTQQQSRQLGQSSLNVASATTAQLQVRPSILH